MTLSPRAVWIAAAALLLAAWLLSGPRTVEHGPGVVAAAAPLQTRPADSAPLQRGEFTLTPLADFSLEARVLSRRDYRRGIESQLAPTDLALGWGRMSDSAVLAQLDISQRGRFYHYRWRGEPPIPPREIVRSSANMHLIPADEDVARTLKRVPPGAIVGLRGQLVEVNRPDGWRWRSSLTREDTGGGACELVLVRELWWRERGEP